MCRGWRGSRTLGWMSLALLATCLACGPAGDPRPKGSIEDLQSLRERNDLNVLFILIDTLRADRLGTYGATRPTSPQIDALAQDGIRFEHHLSQSSWTKASMASLWTGLYPNRSGVLRSRHAVPDAARMPAEIFREAGFRTAAMYRNGWVARNFGFSQGFEIYMKPTPTGPGRARAERDPAKIAGDDGDVIRAATGFLRTHRDDRWFLYLHLLDVHQYLSDAETSVFGTSYSDVYDNAILWTDGLLGHLLEELDRGGMRDRTLIVLTSDHGEAFGEHGTDGHAYDVYGEVIEVPFILSLPFRLEPGIVVETPTENVDLWPTVLDLLGMPPLEDPDGTSMVAAIETAARGEESPDAEDIRIAHLDGTWARMETEPAPIVSVSEGHWRLIYQGSERPLELFDKLNDPREQESVAEEHADVADALREEAEAYLERIDSPWGGEAPSVEIDEMELNQLRALGYGV